MIRLILNENEKLKPLRSWLELQTWTVKDFCFLREGMSPSNEGFTPDRDSEMLLIRYLASCQVKPVNCDNAKAQNDLNSAAATGVGSICYGIQYKPADLIDCARKASVAIPYYMQHLDKLATDLMPGAQIHVGSSEDSKAGGSYKRTNEGVQIEALDSSHEYHATELAIAIASWQDLFINGGYNPNDSRNDNAQIKDLLKGKHRSLGSNAVKAIARIITPDKMTGSRKR
jgi:hypothetical protein